MSGETWARYTWDLSRLAAPGPGSPPATYTIRSGVSAELPEIVGVLAAACGSDPKREVRLGEILGRVHLRVRATLGRPDSDYLLATSGHDIVAVSGLSKAHETGQNLLTGVCIHPRHQRRGLGTLLLSHSLHRLKGLGVPLARVYTEEGSIADRFLYPRFDSARIAPVDYPGGRSDESSRPASRLMQGWVRFS